MFHLRDNFSFFAFIHAAGDLSSLLSFRKFYSHANVRIHGFMECVFLSLPLSYHFHVKFSLSFTFSFFVFFSHAWVHMYNYIPLS